MSNTATNLHFSSSCSMSVLARAGTASMVVAASSRLLFSCTEISENFPRMLLNVLVPESLVLWHPVQDQAVWCSRWSLFLSQQRLGGMIHREICPDRFWGWKNIFFFGSLMSAFLIPASFPLFKRHLGLDLILALKFYLTLTIKQWWKWWEMLGHEVWYRQEWNRSQKVRFAPELFKAKSFIHLFLLTGLEVYEAVKNKLRCNAVSVTMLVEFRYDWEKEFVSLVAENCLFYKVPWRVLSMWDL